MSYELMPMWSRVVEDASKVAEGIRKDQPTEALVHLAHVFQWTLNFVTRLQKEDQTQIGLNSYSFSVGIDKVGNEIPYKFKTIEDVLWYKYPGICTHCVGSECGCPGSFVQKEYEAEKRINDCRRKKRGRPRTLSEWDETLGAIFKRVHRTQSVADMGFHFLEEVGEVSRAIRRLLTADKLREGNIRDQVIQRQINLIEEIADVLSWSFSLTRRFGERHSASQAYVDSLGDHRRPLTAPGSRADEILDPAFKMADILWSAYRLPIEEVEELGLGNQQIGCPICKKPICSDECDSALV